MEPATELHAIITWATAASSRQDPSERTAEYRRLAKLAGSDCGLQPWLGDLAAAARLWPEAAWHYREAMRCGASVEGLEESLRAALIRMPELPTTETVKEETTHDARLWYELGASLFLEGNFQGALDAFAQAGDELGGRERFRMLRLQALALARLGRFEEAAAVVEKLLTSARDQDEKTSAELTRHDVERARTEVQSPNETLERTYLRKLTVTKGEVVQVECFGERAVFLIQAGDTVVKLLVTSPQDVISGEPGGKALEFSCGPQRRPVVVGYEARPDTSDGTAGLIRYLQFSQP